MYTKKIFIAMSNDNFDLFFKIVDSFGCKITLRAAEREMMQHKISVHVEDVEKGTP